jgi:hypothetical protein
MRLMTRVSISVYPLLDPTNNMVLCLHQDKAYPIYNVLLVHLN